MLPITFNIMESFHLSRLFGIGYCLMNEKSKVPNEFKVSIFPDYVRHVTASAIISAQYVEKVYKYLCLILLPDKVKFTFEDMMSGDSTKTRQTLGMINKKLGNSQALDSSFSDRFSEYIRRRNRIVHSLFSETFTSHSDIHIESPNAQKYVQECEWVAEEGAQLVEVGFGIFRSLGELFKSSINEHNEFVEILISFNEFHELGDNYIAADFKSYMSGSSLKESDKKE